MDELEKVILDALPDNEFKKHFIERRDRHGIKNVVTCDAPCFVIKSKMKELIKIG